MSIPNAFFRALALRSPNALLSFALSGSGGARLLTASTLLAPPDGLAPGRNGALSAGPTRRTAATASDAAPLAIHRSLVAHVRGTVRNE
ncbi:hypothetical protein GCM10009766_07170 [Microcella frigidaquae]